MKRKIYAIVLIVILIFCSGCGEKTNVKDSNSSVELSSEQQITSSTKKETKSTNTVNSTSGKVDSSSIPKLDSQLKDSVETNSTGTYSNRAYITVNGNIPTFNSGEYTTNSFERYSSLDSLGRCGVAYACIGRDLMPTTERGSIGQVKPSGWHTVKYDCVDGKYLYNRCHLIGWQLTAENANNKNLITGTRYLNVSGMLPFENMVADYIKETNNHVLYRVTPDFHGSELVARGVFIEAYSVEDQGAGICFNVYCYNVQPGVTINYVDGSSWMSGSVGTTATPTYVTTCAPVTTTAAPPVASVTNSNVTYVGNKDSKKFHKPTCGSVTNMKESNKEFFYCDRDQVLLQGYEPCKNCNP